MLKGLLGGFVGVFRKVGVLVDDQEVQDKQWIDIWTME